VRGFEHFTRDAEKIFVRQERRIEIEKVNKVKMIARVNPHVNIYQTVSPPNFKGVVH